ncbi:hypothetical protein FHS21_003506 [Phyllobacterium trifolii]|jgi:hypothetical protein|uniref:Uncharacterized protein n=1 Tax=Phyllobacterium trifolii TaxID=300193 RepID=A0A839UDW2_9HYPH|nr:hypothetical protein [Phyllobacterium trifolii]MBB3147090.1 hypothetical protein [Phyllobacterium trifolii]
MMAVADGTVQIENVNRDAADPARIPLVVYPPQSSFGFPSRTILIPMIALFLPTGNHDVEKTLTLTNRYTNIYLCT